MKTVWLVASYLMAIVLLLVSCTPTTPGEQEEAVVTEDKIAEEDATETPERHRVDQAPVLISYQGPRGPGGLAITESNYDGMSLVNETHLFYFESTGGLTSVCKQVPHS